MGDRPIPQQFQQTSFLVQATAQLADAAHSTFSAPASQQPKSKWTKANPHKQRTPIAHTTPSRSRQPLQDIRSNKPKSRKVPRGVVGTELNRRSATGHNVHQPPIRIVSYDSIFDKNKWPSQPHQLFKISTLI
jgi:hypothetical protein